MTEAEVPLSPEDTRRWLDAFAEATGTRRSWRTLRIRTALDLLGPIATWRAVRARLVARAKSR